MIPAQSGQPVQCVAANPTPQDYFQLTTQVKRKDNVLKVQEPPQVQPASDMSSTPEVLVGSDAKNNSQVQQPGSKMNVNSQGQANVELVVVDQNSTASQNQVYPKIYYIADASTCCGCFPLKGGIFAIAILTFLMGGLDVVLKSLPVIKCSVNHVVLKVVTLVISCFADFALVIGSILLIVGVSGRKASLFVAYIAFVIVACVLWVIAFICHFLSVVVYARDSRSERDAHDDDCKMGGETRKFSDVHFGVISALNFIMFLFLMRFVYVVNGGRKVAHLI